MMRRLRCIAVLITLSVLLTGCATTFQSEVIAFHDWPGALPNRTFAFERSPEQAASLEYIAYEHMVRNELSRLGYIPESEGRGTTLAVALSYGVRTEQIIVTTPYDPFWYGPRFYPGGGWRHNRLYRPYPYYDPFWRGPVPLQQTVYPAYTHHLHITIIRTADKKPLYEVEVVSEGSNAALLTAMPYMVRSAFSDFPGQSGVMRQVRLKME